MFVYIMASLINCITCTSEEDGQEEIVSGSGVLVHSVRIMVLLLITL